MKTLTAATARKMFSKLIDEVAESHQPVLIRGERNNAVLVSDEDWRAVQETLHLSSITGMRESIIKGINTPSSECSEDIEWVEHE